MNAWQMVVPTKVNPRFFSALLIASERGVLATFHPAPGRFTTGAPSTNLHKKSAKLPISRLSSRQALRVPDRPLHLQPVPDNPGVAHQPLHFPRVEPARSSRCRIA